MRHGNQVSVLFLMLFSYIRIPLSLGTLPLSLPSNRMLSHRCWPEILHHPVDPVPAYGGQVPWQPTSGAGWVPAGWPGPPRLGRWGCTEAPGRCPAGEKDTLWRGPCCCALHPDSCPSIAGPVAGRCLSLGNSPSYYKSGMTEMFNKQEERERKKGKRARWAESRTFGEMMAVFSALTGHAMV